MVEFWWRHVKPLNLHISYNFGPSLVNWFRLCYLQHNDVSGTIQNNGWVSESFTLSIGVSEGCLMSPYLFIISAEILANFIKRDEDIKGFKTSWSRAQTKPIRWWHDVNTRRLRGSILKAIEDLDGFHVTSCLKVNYEKTKVLWVGSANKRGPIKCNKPDISWSPGWKEKILHWAFGSQRTET